MQGSKHVKEIAVEFHDVYHVYEGEQHSRSALDGIDIKILPGEHIAVIGPNGSGKSTLAKHINGLLQPLRGTVTVHGVSTADSTLIWEVRRSAGMVFQNPDNQLVATTVEDDVAFGLENLGLPSNEMEERIKQSLQQVGITDLREREPHRLSGGQKQKVAIAGIMAMKPSVIILDEATSMLDPAGRQEVLETIRRLNREEGITVINITHHLEETLHADRVVVMNKGRVLYIGKPDEVYAQDKRLTDIGLDVPFTVKLRSNLRQNGWNISAEGLNTEQLVKDLWKLLLKN